MKLRLETRGSEPRRLGVIIPFIKNRIITPIIEEIVGRSPRFIGSLVSSNKATIIADAQKHHCSYLSKLFTIINPHQVMPPNTLLLL